MIKLQHIENIVIGQPLVNPYEMFSEDKDDWNSNESDKTYCTNERYLPRILVDLGIYPSISERNYKNSCGVARYCKVYNNKEIPYGYSLELDCHGFIRPKWCPLTEI